MREFGRVEFAHTLRGLAAVFVLIAHYGGVFWTAQPVVETLINAPELPVQLPSYLAWVVWFPRFNWGAFGVALFFIISGFVIPFSFRRNSGPSFLVARFFRLWPLYAVGFSITLLAIHITGEVYARPWPYTADEVLVHYFPGLREAMWSRSIDGIIWTLDIEVKFYLVAALMAGLFRARSMWVFVAPLVVAALMFGLMSPGEGWLMISPWVYKMALGLSHAAPYVIFMFIGTVFHYLHVQAIRSEVAMFLAAGLFLLSFTMMGHGVAPRSVQAQIWSYGFAVVCFAAAASFPALFVGNRVTNFLANISYPLYVVHGISGYVTLHFMIVAGWPAWLALIVTTLAAFALAWVLHKAVELPSQAFGKWLTQRPAPLAAATP